MAAPSSTSSVVLSVALNDYLRRNATNRRGALNAKGFLSASAADAEYILGMCERAQSEVNWYNQFGSIVGIGAYAADNLTPATTEQQFVADLTEVRDAHVAVVDEITATFPPDGYLQDPPIVNGQRSLKTYTPAQTANLRNDLQRVVDAIEP